VPTSAPANALYRVVIPEFAQQMSGPQTSLFRKESWGPVCARGETGITTN